MAGSCAVAQGGGGMIVTDSIVSVRGMRSSDIQPELVAHLGFTLAPGSGVAPMLSGSCAGCPGELCPKL